MLTYDGKKLSYDQTVIKTADITLPLQYSEEANIFGILEMSNQVLKTIEFVKCDGLYKGRLVIDENDIDFIYENKFSIKTASQTFSGQSNKIKLLFDLSTIKLNVKRKTSREVQELKLQIKALEEKINSIVKNHRLLNINITDYSYVQKGMVPVADDNKGNFVLAYPFSNTINKINGIESADQEILLTGESIPYKEDDVSITEKIQMLIYAISQINSALIVVKDTQKQLLDKVSELEITLQTYLENPVI